MILIIYRLLINLVIIFSPIILIIRLFKKKEDLSRFKEKFCFFSEKRKNGNLIWFHGASVGEIKSIVPLIEKLEKEKKINQILVTSSTLSSSKIFKKFKFKKTIHQFYPIDHSFFTKRFLQYWKPHLAIFIESEIWPCMFKELDDKKIPLILLNARLTKKTFGRWMKIKNFSRLIFSKIKMAFPQNLETKKYLKKMKIKKINFIGNLKFAETEDKKENTTDNKFKLKFKNKKIWIASSTHANEEIFCAHVHIELKKKIKNLLTIIIPRHINRVKEISSNIEKLNLTVTSHKSNNKNLKNTDIYIVDTFGDTKKFHKIGSSVFLGGSIIKRGGQNPLEAARYGARIFHGPNIDNFREVYNLLKNLKVSKKISSPKELAKLISFKRNINIGLKIKKIGRKILKKTIKELDNLINNEFKKT